ncbi:YihY/virulence factor BrkB family protein [Antribacter sp. KLBMP9083]|uniref:YihY/virulence factor BrkB family protein n=1 Tax=Antribacter soli TaxID=2910976 RepID=A0AA41QFR9_9MICO|nr:YihY/virulence factor BrkB family protein [Antribacter soli]MCF4122288.1 YihY/virulence factor BrkB family protein [Antribacter soli]
MNDADTASERAGAPAPDHPSKPEAPTDLHRRSWAYVLRTTVRQFSRDHCLDLAAALTYYAVLAVAPALLALVSLLGLVGNPERMVDQVVGTMEGLVPEDVLSVVTPLVENAAEGGVGAGLALALGLVLALWSASGYVGAFGRAMNRVYEIDEGRPVWILRPLMLLVTVVTVVIAALVVASLVLTGPVARAVGEAVGLGDATVAVWDVAKWPVVLALVAVLLAILYHWTPNVQQPHFRWISVGAVVAILVWMLASVAFGYYVANLASYGATYGTLAGFIVFLLWVWITNLALLFGAELDSELERGRELQAGIEAEETVQLPPRDTRASDKRQNRWRDDVERGRALRVASSRGRGDDDRQHATDGPRAPDEPRSTDTRT